MILTLDPQLKCGFLESNVLRVLLAIRFRVIFKNTKTYRSFIIYHLLVPDCKNMSGAQVLGWWVVHNASNKCFEDGKWAISK